MKAHISKHAVLLCGGFDEALLKETNAICSEGGVTLTVVPKNKYGLTVGALCGLPGAGKEKSPIEGEIPNAPVMVISDFSDAQLNLLLDTLADKNMDVSLKALVTKTNAEWPFFKLAQELQAEHEAMSANAVK